MGSASFEPDEGPRWSQDRPDDWGAFVCCGRIFSAYERRRIKWGYSSAGRVNERTVTPAENARSGRFHLHATATWALRIAVPLSLAALLVVVPTGPMDTTPRTYHTSAATAGAPASAPALLWSRASPGSGTAGIGSGPSTTSPRPGNWSTIQVAFLLETTAYDGVYDPAAGDPGYDPCGSASSTAILCEESNGVPVFATRAGQIVQGIAAAHPGSNVSFALADFFSTLGSFDDGDGYAFHVDVQNFTAASAFQSAVNHSFRSTVLGGTNVYGDSDLSDNILHSSSISGLYGALGTSGFNWTGSAHHVVVLIGSTAPRAPGYVVNYTVSASDYSTFCGTSCLSPTCEPAYNYTSGASPACEGWVHSQSANVSRSIAWLAQHGTLCAGSLGGNCTVDTISLYNGVTDPLSKQWPTGRKGGGPNGSIVRTDTNHILNASCDLAAATGGSWDGPNFFTCPNGVKGNLSFVSVVSSSTPNTTNPSLLSAFLHLSVGAPAPRHPGFNQPGDLLITDQFNNRVIEVNPLTKQIVWSFGSGNASLCNPGPGAVIAPNDAERLALGYTLIAGTGTSACPDNRVIVVNPDGRIVWQYGRAGVAGNTTGLLNVPVFALQLSNHDMLIVDQANNRVIEVTLAHRIVWSYGPTSGPGALNNPNSAERLPNGDLLIADESNNRVIEVNRTGHVVWQFAKGLQTVAFASRLPNGDTVIADSGHNRIVVINATNQVVFRYWTNRTHLSQANPNPTQVVELRGGDFLIADQFNDRVIVVDPSRQTVFQYGMTNVVGAGFDQLNAPYSAVAIGDYTGLTAPPPMFL